VNKVSKFGIFKIALRHRSLHEGGCHGIYPDAKARGFQRQGFGETFYRVFREAIDGRLGDPTCPIWEDMLIIEPLVPSWIILRRAADCKEGGTHIQSTSRSKSSRVTI